MKGKRKAPKNTPVGHSFLSIPENCWPVSINDAIVDYCHHASVQVVIRQCPNYLLNVKS